ncbi:hypothetical protein FHETE_6965 [Fusarium heterosporum]|uniref:Xylanolytic transcriptional activator regulatory domain-containing protein n=1 Tax=Fusarium heterosporum TaxID=42747 RepID=A0A8H5T8X8_FUSHE|nr:hypothetical protein FHETE_6965 [Fusarium heterosporum]
MHTYTTKTELKSTVILPDLFKGFVVDAPRKNQYYETVKPISETWLAERCRFSTRMRKRVEFCDFALFISIAAPDASAERLKTLCDWGNWVFPFDDMFDEGSLKADQKRSQVVIDSLMANMLGRTYKKPKTAVVQAHDDIFRRVSQGSSPGIRRRFALAMKDYTDGVVHHVKSFATSSIPSIEEMLKTRQLSSGVTPLYHLVEYAHGIKLPDAVFDNPVIQTLERLGVDFVLLSNDILSYRKEENDDCPFSMVAACRMTGQSPQEAFNTVGDLLEQRYEEWERTIAQLPSWGPKTDVHVARYIQGIQDVVQANVTWSFQSGRYFGKQAAEIRRTRMVDVMVNPPFMRAMKLQTGRSMGVFDALSRRMSCPMPMMVLSFTRIFGLLAPTENAVEVRASTLRDDRDAGLWNRVFNQRIVRYSHQLAQSNWPHNNKTPEDVTIIDPEANLHLQDALDVLPAKPQLDALVEAFFSNINHHYNIIHPSTFIRQYMNWSKEKPQACYQDIQLTILILMMCACVTQHLDINSMDTPPFNTSSADYHEAGQKLSAVIPSNLYHLANVQWKILSICWFKGEAKFMEAWHTIGVAVQEAYELGLHKAHASKAGTGTQAQIGRQAWRVLYCWNWQLSSILGRPLMMPDIDLEPEVGSPKTSAPTPTLHTKLQYQLISSLAKRWQTPQDINSPTEIKIYKKIVEGHISSLPPVFAIHHPDTSKDREWPWLVAHRYYIQTMAYFMILQPYKLYLSNSSATPFSAEMQNLIAEAVEYSLKALQAATRWASQVLDGDGQFHLIVLCLFDTAAFLSTTLDKDQPGAIANRNMAVLAVDEAASILRQLRATSQGAKSSYKLLRRILRRLNWNDYQERSGTPLAGNSGRAGDDRCSQEVSSTNTA